jgi:hypothetical protein
MSSDLNQNPSFLKNIKSVAPKHCDLCGHMYDEADFHLVKNQQQQTVIHLRCHNCGNSYMLNVYSPMAGVLGSSRSQLNLDLTQPDELSKFAGQEPVSINQALDGFNLLVKSDFLAEFMQKKLQNSASGLNSAQKRSA